MNDGPFAKQGKKLLFIGIFLVLVMALVGREDDPGVIANLAEGSGGPVPSNYQPVDLLPPGSAPMRPPAPVPAPSDPGLSEWYAEADSDTGAVEPEPFVPAPIDNSHLVNDARPIGIEEPVG